MLSDTTKNVQIIDRQKFDEIVKQFAMDGPDQLHVLTDFDRTLTLATVNGVAVPSITAILRDHNYLTPDYPARAKALYAKYRPIESDPNIPKEQKKKLMEEWWTVHFELFKECGLNSRDLGKAMNSGVVRFRPGVSEFLIKLQKKNVALVIMSASGLGSGAIRQFFEHEKLLLDNIYVIGNEFIWDENGNLAEVKKPIITGTNKDETMLQNFPVYEKVKNRKNVLLLGDNLDDVGMIEGFPYDHLLKVGFLNNNSKEETLEEYGEQFDAVILNDGPFDFINSILEKIIN